MTFDGYKLRLSSISFTFKLKKIIDGTSAEVFSSHENEDSRSKITMYTAKGENKAGFVACKVEKK